MFECINGQLPEHTVVLFEEGFIQKSLMFKSQLSSKDESRLFSYLNNVPCPHTIIYIKTDLEVCYERMMLRSKGLTNRFKNTDERGVLKALKTSDAYIQKIASWMTKNKNVHVIEVNNNQDVEKVVVELEKKLRIAY